MRAAQGPTARDLGQEHVGHFGSNEVKPTADAMSCATPEHIAPDFPPALVPNIHACEGVCVVQLRL